MNSKDHAPSMHRRQFELIADIIKALPDDRCRMLDMRTNRPVNMKGVVAEHFANELERRMRNFKRDVFLSQFDT